jgi:hypothetical protein
MQLKNKLSDCLVLLIWLGLFYEYLVNFSSVAILGGGLLVWFFVYFHRGAELVLRNFFGFDSNWRTKILAYFFTLLTLIWCGGVVVVFWVITPLSLLIIFGCTGLIAMVSKFWAERGLVVIEKSDAVSEVKLVPSNIWFHLLSAVFLALVGYGFWILYQARTGVPLTTPWQTIGPVYIYVFAAATFILGWLVFSPFHSKILLFFLILHGLLLHSYLPLTHQLYYGGDGWRHLAIETRLAEGRPMTPVLSDSAGQSWIQRHDFGQISYTQFWGLGVILNKMLSASLLVINIWLIPILWSVIFPILLYELGRAWNFSKSSALFMVWLSALPFAWQVGGALTLPVNLGFLIFLFFLVLVFRRQQSFGRQQILIMLATMIGLALGYVLYAILGALIWVLAEWFRLAQTKQWRYWPWIPAVLLAFLIIPSFEILSGYSAWPNVWNSWESLKQFIGNFSGWYLASGPRVHDITTGNIILNQTPLSTFVPNIFSANRFWLVPTMLAWWLAVIVAWFKNWRAGSSNDLAWQMFIGGTVVSYLVGRYYFVGDQILSRRLDNVLALVAIYLVVVFFQRWLVGFSDIANPQRWKQWALIGFLSILMATSYSLGPDLQAVSADELSAIQSIMPALGTGISQGQPMCVLADTYPLLALEGISGKEIVGGGFPMGRNFAQLERVALYEQMRANPAAEIFYHARELTLANTCYFVVDKGKVVMNDYLKSKLPVGEWGKIIIWKD